MEIFQDLFFTISFSLIVSLILAKLFSISSSSVENKCNSSSKSALSEDMKSLACDAEKCEPGEMQLFQEKGIDNNDNIQNNKLVTEAEVVGLEEKKDKESVFVGKERKCEGEMVEKESVGGDVVLLPEQEFDEINERSFFSEIEVEQVENDVVEIVDDDDDWEGIERTELENIFWAAIAFLGSKNSNADMISNEVKMQLYGLNKVATQGPCSEPQPMAIKVSARANWNAWKRVGNISPEEAMEQYITLLSQHVPHWMVNDSEIKGKTS